MNGVGVKRRIHRIRKKERVIRLDLGSRGYEDNRIHVGETGNATLHEINESMEMGKGGRKRREKSKIENNRPKEGGTSIREKEQSNTFRVVNFSKLSALHLYAGWKKAIFNSPVSFVLICPSGF